MPIVTTLGQRCTVFLDEDGIQRFKIASSIDAVLAGDLPLYGATPFTSNIFVHKIIAPLDPKSDTFLRVATVFDLTTLPLTRDIAVGLGQTFFIARAFDVIYDDISTASTAKLLIQQRVDNLIADWHTYNEKFLDPLNAPFALPPYTYSDIALPLTNSLEDQLKTAYNTAHAELLDAKAATALAAAAAATTLSAATAANEEATTALSASQACSTQLGQFNQGYNAYSNYRNVINPFVTAASAMETASVVWKAAAQAFQAASGTFTTACGVYIALGASPGAIPLATFTAAKDAWELARVTYNAALTAWTAVQVGFSASAAAAAVAEEALLAFPQLTTSANDHAKECTAKIADVTAAAGKKTDADKAAAESTTAKKAADEAQSAAQIAETTAYLAVKALCPEFTATVP